MSRIAYRIPGGHGRRGIARRASRRLTGSYQQRTLRLLAVRLVFDYADRTLAGALGLTLKRVFSLNNLQLGLLAAAFSFMGTGAGPPWMPSGSTC